MPILESLIEADYEVVAVVTQPDRPVGRKIITPTPVKEAALKHDLLVLQPEKSADRRKWKNQRASTRLIDYRGFRTILTRKIVAST